MSKEAMKLALDALVYASSYCDTYDAITALREALAEQPAQQGHSCYCPNCEALSKELAAQRKPLTPDQKQQFAENWFAEDWAITKAIGMMIDHERLLGIKENT